MSFIVSGRCIQKLLRLIYHWCLDGNWWSHCWRHFFFYSNPLMILGDINAYCVYMYVYTWTHVNTYAYIYIYICIYIMKNCSRACINHKYIYMWLTDDCCMYEITYSKSNGTESLAISWLMTKKRKWTKTCHNDSA